jgi:carbonic anhydrase
MPNTELNKAHYQSLFENNKAWVTSKLKLDPEYFGKLAEGQAPKFLFIGCSDSRVDACEITGTEPGDMFVHRNIANLVNHTDLNLLSVLQYSIEVLKVEHVIVCGHYGCGGVKAAMGNTYNGLIDKWLRNIKDVYRLHRDELNGLETFDERWRRLVELNIKEQVFHLFCTSFVQRAWREEKQTIHVHGWVYDIHEGIIHDLEVDPKKDFPEFDLYKYGPYDDFISWNNH